MKKTQKPATRPEPLASAIAISTPHIKASGMALTFQKETTKDEWLAAGHSVLSAMAFSGFMLGDWLIFGEATFTKDEAGKKFYDDAEKMTGLDNGTLRNMKVVAKAFPPDKRRTGVSFEHHRLLASGKDKPETIALLDRIGSDKLSVAAMKETEEFKALKAKPTQTPEQMLAEERKKQDHHDEVCRAHAQTLITYFEDMPPQYQFAWHKLISEIGEAVKTVAPVISSAHRAHQAQLQKIADAAKTTPKK